MKSFFEEYGFVILAAIVVILLIAMTTPIGSLVKNQITGIVDSFANKTNTKLNAVNIGDNTAKLAYEGEKLMLSVSSNNSTDTFTAYATYTSKGKEITDETLNIVSKSAGKYEVVLASDAAKNTDIQIKVINDGTQEVSYSNVLLIGTANSSGSGGSDSGNTQTYITKALNTNYIEYYADIDDDGAVDGVIFVDLCAGMVSDWGDDDIYAFYLETDVSYLKDYYVSQESYSGDFGTKPVISPVSGTSGDDRFYVMALEDATSDTKTYNSAKEYESSGWHLPYKDELGFFLGYFNIESGNYEEFGLSKSYWAKSDNYLYFDIIEYDHYQNRTSSHYVRLATSF